MITEIFENLFEPLPDEEVDRRRPKQKYKVGDVLVAKQDLNKFNLVRGKTFTVKTAQYFPDYGHFEYVLESDGDGDTWSFWADEVDTIMNDSEKV